MSTTVSNELDAFILYAKQNDLYQKSRYVASESVESGKVGGIIPGLDATLALIGAGTSLFQGISNLLRDNDSSPYNITLNIRNLSSYVVTIASASRNYTSSGNVLIKPGQKGSITANDSIGKYSSGDTTDIKLVLVSTVDPDNSFNLSLRWSGESDTDTSRIVQINGVKLDDDSDYVKNPDYNSVAAWLNAPVWTCKNEFGTFMVHGTGVGTSKSATINLSILETL